MKYAPFLDENGYIIKIKIITNREDVESATIVIIENKPEIWRKSFDSLYNGRGLPQWKIEDGEPVRSSQT